MKNLFAIDIDKDQCEFDPFVIRRVDTELSEKQEKAVEEKELSYEERELAARRLIEELADSVCR
jgi:hypothetical protein